MPTLSVITPTIGRESLDTMLAALLPQLEPGDEVLVVGDGPQPEARRIVGMYGSPLVRYWETEPIRNYGNPQRNLAIAEAKGDYIVFIDDDDRPTPRCASTVRSVAGLFPGRPLMFKMPYMGGHLWRAASVAVCNVSGQMFVPPNVKGRLGKWSGKYAADYDFIRSTVDLYPERDAAVVWREEVITVQGLAGRSPLAREM